MTITTCVHYAAFGLTVESELPLPPLVPLASPSGPADVQVRRGPVPAQLEGATSLYGDLVQAQPGACVINAADTVRMLIRDGTEIVVQPLPGADDRTVALWLLGTGMSALLHQRGLLVLHASSVAGERGAVAFLGRSGAGKSTLAGALAKLGYRVVTDDICVVVQNGEQPGVLAGYPYLKLWPDAVAGLGREHEPMEPLGVGMDKLAARVPALDAADPIPLRRLYELRPAAVPGVVFEPLPARERLAALAAHTNRRPMVAALGASRVHFEAAAALAGAVPIMAVARPFDGCPPDELARLIEPELRP
jgi:hypothetical protein